MDKITGILGSLSPISGLLKSVSVIAAVMLVFYLRRLFKKWMINQSNQNNQLKKIENQNKLDEEISKNPGKEYGKDQDEVREAFKDE